MLGQLLVLGVIVLINSASVDSSPWACPTEHRQYVYYYNGCPYEECLATGGCWDESATNVIQKCYEKSGGSCDVPSYYRIYKYHQREIKDEQICKDFFYGCWDESATGSKCYRKTSPTLDDKCSCQTSVDRICFVVYRSPCVGKRDCGFGEQLVFYICPSDTYLFGFIIQEGKCCVGKCDGFGGHANPECQCKDVFPFCGQH